MDDNASVSTNQQETRPHVCEMPDCSAVSVNKISIIQKKNINSIFSNK